MSSILDHIYEQNAWANLAMLDLVESLTDEQLDAPTIDGTMGTIRQMITHIANSQEGYVAGLSGVTREPWTEFPGFPALRDSLTRTNRKILEFANQVPDRTIIRTWNEQDYEIEPEVFLVQAINHATEHRIHIKVALTQLEVEHPFFDGWGYGGAKGLFKTKESVG
ncbi:MAG TPA: DinB family protein [Actinomycetota bacterium]|nr:DinB family protein [Actinomycetota bacterium]